MADLADHAFAHAVAVLGAGAAAELAAARAVRLGGRSLGSVLAHARHAALAAAPGPPAGAAVVVTATDSPVPDDVTELARVLAGTRPPGERAIVDLDTRHGLDGRGLGRALGLAPAAAAALAAAVATAWEAALDPVLLARLGPAGCEVLEGILESAGLWQPPALTPVAPTVPVTPRTSGNGAPSVAGNGSPAPRPNGRPVPVAEETPVFVPEPEVPPPPEPPARDVAAGGPPPSLATLVAAAPMVGDHLRVCPACGDRRRAVVSVRDLLAQVPLEAAPEIVRATAPAGRLGRLAPPPPVLGPGRAPPWRRAAAGVAAAVVAVGAFVAWAGRGRDDASRVADLVRLPPGPAALAAEALAAEGPEPAVRLRNRSDRAVAWRADPSTPLLATEPRSGTLRPGESAVLRVLLADPAAEGVVRGSVTVLGDDGSAAQTPVALHVDRPPGVDASAAGCAVTARVEDEGEVRSVVLHWSDGSGPALEQSLPMEPEGGWYTAALPAARAALTWWVSAGDGRGNTARTPASVLEPGAC